MAGFLLCGCVGGGGEVRGEVVEALDGVGVPEGPVVLAGEFSVVVRNAEGEEVVVKGAIDLDKAVFGAAEELPAKSVAHLTRGDAELGEEVPLLSGAHGRWEEAIDVGAVGHAHRRCGRDQ